MKTSILCSLLLIAGLSDTNGQVFIQPSATTPETTHGTRAVVGVFNITIGETPATLRSVKFKITLEKERGRLSHLKGIKSVRLYNTKTRRFLTGATNVTEVSRGLAGFVNFTCTLPVEACETASIGVWVEFTEKYPEKSRFALTLDARDLTLLDTNGLTIPPPPAHTILVAKTSAKIDFDLRPPCGNLGDIDGDGLVTEEDHELVGYYASGQGTVTPELLERLDVNGDGRVTISDWVLEANYLVGIITTFPACAN